MLNMDADNFDDARKYFKQRFANIPGYEARSFHLKYNFGCIATILELATGKFYLSLYIYKSYRGLGKYRVWAETLAPDDVVFTIPDCNIEAALKHMGINHKVHRMRPTKPDYYLGIAKAVSTRATCPRLSVGAVIVDVHDRIISTGYNGSPKGTPHCTDEGCEMVDIDGRPSCMRALHAESNAIDRAPWSEMKGAHLYVTVTPCYDCAKRIISAGIAVVTYASHYESRKTGLTLGLLEDAGVGIVRPNPQPEENNAIS